MSDKIDFEFEPVIGLEVHCQLGTASKLFCACPSSGFGAAPNSHVCPVCTGQPGTLPVLNGRAVELAFTAALALGCKIRPESVFARKNYFYPDLPKGYQISQYEEPFSSGGGVEIEDEKGRRTLRLHRIHLEEDAGKLVHEIGAEALPYSLVDFNRGGAPLIEIVSEPDMRSSAEAYLYLGELKAALQYLGVSNCDMEKGEMRCDANVSIRRKGAEAFGVKVEVKNLNSFKAVRDAIDHEIARQAEVLRAGGKIAQETRLWDDAKRSTRTMRSKEEAHDYRYFPEPDLVPLVADEAWVARLRAGLGELPRARKERFMRSYGLDAYVAGVLVSDKALSEHYEQAVKMKPEWAGMIANLETNQHLALLKEHGLEAAQSPLTSRRLYSLAELTATGRVSGTAAREVLAGVFRENKDPEAIVSEKGLAQVSDDSQLREWAQAAVSETPKAVADYKGGNERALGAIVGVVMKKSRGKANPGRINELLKEILK